MRGAAVVLSLLLWTATAPAAAMTLSFDWGPTRSCFDPNSPPMHMTDVPEATATIEFVMQDLDAPAFRHGGGTVKYHGKDDFPYGAFRYKGPCPPARHLYEFTAIARDAAGNTLATAKARRSFARQ